MEVFNMLLQKDYTNTNNYKKFKIDSKNLSWTPDSWRLYPALQQPTFQDVRLFQKCIKKLKEASEIVSFSKIQELKNKIASAEKGKSFLFQAGDCAELFKDCTFDRVKLKILELTKQKEILQLGLNKEITLIGRIAGQFAKPRSESYETIENITLPAYRGDIINSSEFTYEARVNNPINLIKSYHKSKKVLNYAQIFNKNSYTYSSHEALLLDYESALTRYDARYNQFYNSSSHFVWVGERTRQINGAHIRYLSGITNPIGIKFSENITTDELIKMVEILNPNQENGKIVLIPRMGHQKISDNLPKFIRSIYKEGFNVTWMSDPMHGNTEKTKKGIKTRSFNKILDELIQSLQIHKSENSFLGGMHLETSPDNVTECTGGFQDITEKDLLLNYQTACDPRLNSSQTIEIISKFIKEYVRISNE
jgi:3-deoxy-7-phosphoheptulonate synthase